MSKSINFLRQHGVHFIDLNKSSVLHGDEDRDKIMELIGSGDRLEFPVLLTPGLAKICYEDLNNNIRKLQKSRAKAYIDDIENKDWVNWIPRICFNVNCYMVNGQHTCNSFMVTGHEGIVTFRTGFTKADEEVCDNGSPRKAYQNANIDKNTSSVLSAIKMYGHGKTYAITAAKLKKLYSKYGTAVESLLEKSNNNDVLKGSAFLSALSYVMVEKKVKLSASTGFMKDVVENKQCIFSEYKEIMSDPQRKGGAAEKYRFRLTLFVFKSYLQGKNIKKCLKRLPGPWDFVKDPTLCSF